MSFSEGCRLGSDPTLLWLWCRLAATALIKTLAWEPPYAADVALEKTKKKGKKKKRQNLTLCAFMCSCYVSINLSESKQLSTTT